MSVFIDPHISSYREDPRIQSSLRGHVLLNKEEFMNWIRPEDVRNASRIENSVSLAHRTETREQITEIFNYVLQAMSEHVCSGIEEEYGKSAIDPILNEIDEFDILVAVVPDYDSMSNLAQTKTATNRKIRKIVGFIVIELGECKKEPKTFSVNLICVKPNTIKGSILLGAYLYCIKNSKNKKKGILELANGYLNVPGFIAYTKMGFDKDLSLYADNCFTDYDNLPMSVNLTHIDADTIINRATDIVRRVVDIDEDDSGIYNLGRAMASNEHAQLLLLIYNNLLYKTALDYEKIIGDDHDLRDEELAEFEKTIQFLSEGSSTKSSKTKKLKVISKSVLIRQFKNIIKEIQSPFLIKAGSISFKNKNNKTKKKRK
jgi:hypothetical protein